MLHQTSQLFSIMGDIFLLNKNPEQALSALLQAKKLGDTSAQTYFNIGSAYLALGDYKDAKIYFDRTLAIDPKMVAAHVNKGLAEHSLMDLSAALDCFNAALFIEPGNIDAQWNKSHVLLTLGRYEDGFHLYETRWKQSKIHLKNANLIVACGWVKKIFQAKKSYYLRRIGFGDTLQFVRYAKLFGDDVELIIQCQKPLIELIKGMGLSAEIITLSDIPQRHDYHCSLMSLPLAFGTTISSIPKVDQYIFVSERYLCKWKDLFCSSSNVRIGVAARGSASHENDKNRSMDLKLFSNFFQKADYFLLQREISEKENLFVHATKNIVAPEKDWKASPTLLQFVNN